MKFCKEELFEKIIEKYGSLLLISKENQFKITYDLETQDLEFINQLNSIIGYSIPIEEHIDENSIAIIIKDGYIEELGLFDMEIDRLPSKLRNLKRLERLELRGNNMDYLDENIQNLTQLKILNLSYNKFTKIPNEIRYLKNLKKLDFSYNKIENIDALNNEVINLEELNLEDNNIDKLPETFFQLINLKKLSLTYNNLSYIPEDFSKFQNLDTLKLTRNPLKNFPMAILEIENLKCLDLSSIMRKFDIPQDISNLKNLEIFILNLCRYREFPNNLNKLQNLKVLDISGNAIHDISEEILRLGNLKFLVMKKTRIMKNHNIDRNIFPHVDILTKSEFEENFVNISHSNLLFNDKKRYNIFKYSEEIFTFLGEIKNNHKLNILI